MPTPRTFFDTIVMPSSEAWASDPLETWKAKAAASNADTMAERVFRHWDKQGRGKILGATSARKYREHLKDNACADFGLVWDIHDGHKHYDAQS